jgi:AcrR family transcriptional regulator
MTEPPGLFESEPETTREAIMKATYEALSTHGYADLTIQRIADEFEKSKSLLYHHYDSKDALLVDFLAYVLERLEDTIPIEEDADADTQLAVAFDHVFSTLLAEPRDDFKRAMLELRAQAAHDDTYRTQFTDNDAYTHSQLVDIIATGVEEGVFRDVDPDRTATMILTIIQGMLLRDATTTDDDRAAVREELAAYIETRLLAED